MKRPIPVLLAVLSLCVCGVALGGPERIAAHDPVYLGERAAWTAHADGVAAWAVERAGAGNNNTGSEFFNGEWDLGTCQMAVIGLSRVVKRFPDTHERYAPAAKACLDWLLTPQAHGFATTKTGHDGLARALDPATAAAPEDAWLGYVGLALGAWREALPAGEPMPHRAAHDALVDALSQRLALRVHTFQTYPGETYPPDQAVAAGAVGAWSRATGDGRYLDGLQVWRARFRRAAIDPDTGLLVQRISSQDGRPIDHPRGSGTGLAAWALSWVDGDLSAELYQAMAEGQLDQQAGVWGMREYPPGNNAKGDIDSGPLVMGVGVSATGFSLAGARVHQDPETWHRLWGTVQTFGLPVDRRDGRWFTTGGPIGNAIMLAMMTAG